MGSLLPDASDISARGRKKPGLTLSIHRYLYVLGLISTLIVLYLLQQRSSLSFRSQRLRPVFHSQETVARCRSLNVKPGPPVDFYSRQQSDRFVPGTKATLIKNATIWTGFEEGREVFVGDLLLDDGLIRWIGVNLSAKIKAAGLDADVIDAEGAWLTPGYVPWICTAI